MLDIKFSVIIPLYNKEQSIVNTLLSVLNQTYKDFEIVVINDGSTDSSVNLVKKIKDERIKIIHQENKGVSAARNRGIKEASYDWVAFLDGDDLWEANHLQEIVNMMDLYPAEKIFVTSFQYSDGREMFKHQRDGIIFEIKKYFKEVIKEELIWTSIIVIHRQCFEKSGLFNVLFNRGEDLDLWARLAKEYKIVKSLRITAIYKIDAENRTNLSRDLKKCHYYHFDLYNYDSEDEVEYYKTFLFNRIIEYLYSQYYYTGFKLLWKYSLRVRVEFFIYFLNFMLGYVYKKLK